MTGKAALFGSLAALAVVANMATAREASLDQRIMTASDDRSAAATLAELTDGLGERLTWSPGYDAAAAWADEKLRRLGLDRVRREHIGVKGIGWEQRLTWLRMTAPDAMQIVSYPAPWSVGSSGPQSGDAVVLFASQIDELDAYRGRLAGKVVLLGGPTPLPEATATPAVSLESRDALDRALVPLRHYFANRSRRLERFAADAAFADALTELLIAEGPKAVIVPGTAHSGAASLSTDSPVIPARRRGWDAAARLPFPVIRALPEHYNRLARLAASRPGVELEWQVDVVETGQRGADNVVADLPGSDPKLAEEVVLIGAHLDSWGGGTGAADNGAGVAIVLEAMRILREADFRPRRTIRVAFFAGEEQGLFGAQAYADTHLGMQPRMTTPEQLDIPVESWRSPAGVFRPKREWHKLSAMINVDGGSGRIRGLFTGGPNPRFAAKLGEWTSSLEGVGPVHILQEPNWPADHWVFSSIGIPTLSLLQEPVVSQQLSTHSNIDVMDNIRPGDLSASAALLAVLLARIADSDAPMPRPAQ